MDFLIRTAGNMVGIWVTTLLMTAIAFRKGESLGFTLLYLFLIAAILTVLNRAVRPVVKVLTFPLYILTLGLFSIVVNGLMFALTAWLSGLVKVPLVVETYPAAALGGTITALVSSVVVGILRSLFASNPGNPN